MDRIKLMLMTFMLVIVLAVCCAQKSLMVNASTGQDVVIPCGVQDKEPVQRLVWKLGDVSSQPNLARSYDESLACNTDIKQNCSLSSDGSLKLHNVQESDSDDYFCVLGPDEKYFSQHTLVVHPEVAFKTCPNSEDVFVTQTGPDEIVVAYTNPVCQNTDGIGIVTCDPPSGAKIGMNFTEIVCTCTYSDNVVDTCEIPIPGIPDADIVCPPVTALWIFLGIVIGAVFCGVLRLIEYFCKKHSLKQSTVMLNKTETTENTESLQS